MARAGFRRSPGRSVLISGDTSSVLVKRDVTEATQPCLPGCTACVSGIGAGAGGACANAGHPVIAPKVSSTTAEASSGDQSHPSAGAV